MITIFNLLCKIFITILDFLLLNSFIKILFPHVFQNQKKKYLFIIYIISSLFLIISKNVLFIILIHCLTIISISIYLSIQHISFIRSFLSICKFYLIKIIVSIVIICLFSWIFNIRISFKYTSYVIPYNLFVQCTIRYAIFAILITFFNKNMYHKHFKNISIFMFTFFGLTVIIDNPILFYTLSTARTYIFTVVISIIALICFDRMQTKYEKDKHLQESIIQNLEKEKEFNQQREQQQKEIRKINHNLNNILIILQSHLEKEEYEEAKDYIEQNLKTHVEAYQALTHTGIAAIDGALNAHIQSIKEKGIQYDENISKILHLGSIVPGDLALIISLALDNAKEACENIDGEKHISLKLQSKQTHVILYIENSIPEGSHPTFHKTSKKDKIAHGFGVSSIKEMAERYHGEAKYEVKHDQVILRVVLQK